MKKCSKCGGQLADDVAFCSRCGERAATQESSAQASTQTGDSTDKGDMLICSKLDKICDKLDDLSHRISSIPKISSINRFTFQIACAVCVGMLIHDFISYLLTGLFWASLRR